MSESRTQSCINCLGNKPETEIAKGINIASVLDFAEEQQITWFETLENKMPYEIMAMVRRKKTFPEKFFIKGFTQKMAYITKKPLPIVPDEE